jgi:hypothetical protein
MPNRMRTAEYWRSKAEEARTRAEGMKTADAQAAMLAIAASYEAMAERAAKREARANSKSSNGATRRGPPRVL